MSELAAVGSIDEDPFPTLLGASLEGEQRASVTQIYFEAESRVELGKARTYGRAIINRAQRPNGVNSQSVLLFRARTMRQTDALRFGGSESDTLKA